MEEIKHAHSRSKGGAVVKRDNGMEGEGHINSESISILRKNHGTRYIYVGKK